MKNIKRSEDSLYLITGAAMKGLQRVKPSNEFRLDDTMLYSPEHTWAKNEDYHITVGITDYAQDQLGDIIYIDLPEPDASFAQNDVFGSLESAKTVSDLYLPLGGTVIAVNQQLADAPELVNQKPYTDGWLIKILPDDRSELKALLSPHDYLEMIRH